MKYAPCPARATVPEEPVVISEEDAANWLKTVMSRHMPAQEPGLLFGFYEMPEVTVGTRPDDTYWLSGSNWY